MKVDIPVQRLHSLALSVCILSVQHCIYHQSQFALPNLLLYGVVWSKYNKDD